MIPTHTLSRRIVAELVERGIEVPQSCYGKVCPECKGPVSSTERGPDAVRKSYYCTDHGIVTPGLGLRSPDLAQPANLHLLLGVVRSLGSAYEIEYCPREEFVSDEHCSFKFKHPLWGDRHYGETESAALFTAVCAALGIDTTQEIGG